MVRFTYKYLKPVALFLSIVVLFQCCKVYYKEPVSVEEALNNDIKRVKIITTDDRVFVFDSIYTAHDKLYGQLRKIKGKNEIEKVGINIKKETIKDIYLYNKKKSKGMTTALIAVGIPLGLVLIVVVGCALDEDCGKFYY
jgi:hypothetical protein